MLFADPAGGWFWSDEHFLSRYALDRITERDRDLLLSGGHAFETTNDLSHSSYLYRWAARHPAPTKEINYLIVVPTLRCNLACDYCQVSRAAEGARGYDWSDETAVGVLKFLDGLTTKSIKIEFQGGEPLLRIDLLEKIRAYCRERFEHSSFVVCSNFQRVDDSGWRFFEAEDTHLSTSIDGDFATHTRQRTHDDVATSGFLDNIRKFQRRFGSDRLSALPTIDLKRPPDFNQLIDAYESFGIRSIYLRPINHQGFARRAPDNANASAIWAKLHREFIEILIERNYSSGGIIEEFYFTHALRRVLNARANGFVDLRNPNPVADNYLVIDYDGTFYPTDEARMMARVGQIDLSVGNIDRGIDLEKVCAMNAHSFNDFDPDCRHCVYQPFCGVDTIDDISRYGRIDTPRHWTWFCQRHMALFDLVFELIASTDPKVQYSLTRWAGVETWPSYFREVYR
jgi:His-Xaa-Ser system radical SAM maturase HxsB